MTDLCLVFVFEMTGICGALNKQVFAYQIYHLLQVKIYSRGLIKPDFHIIFFSKQLAFKNLIK